jgi:biopolymer transport protein TolR
VADINITPMVDVLLCLLILVMVIQPGLLKGVDLQVPAPDPAGVVSRDQPRDQIILYIAPGPSYAINAEPVTAAALDARLREVFRDRPRKVLFVKGTEDASWEAVVAGVDVARGAGINVIGLVPRDRATPAADSARARADSR